MERVAHSAGEVCTRSSGNNLCLRVGFGTGCHDIDQDNESMCIFYCSDWEDGNWWMGLRTFDNNHNQEWGFGMMEDGKGR